MDDFKVIKVKYNQEAKSAHHVFYKKYKLNRNDDMDKLISNNNESNTDLASRTIFVNGLPSYSTIQGVKNVFNIFGNIEQVLIFPHAQQSPFSGLNDKKNSYFTTDESKLEGFKVAYVIYNQVGSAEKAINKPVTDERVMSNKQQPIAVGFKKWIDEYKNAFLDEKKIKKEIESYMLNYDQVKAEKDQEEEDKTNMPDEDGWITVTSKSRKAFRTLTERNVDKLKSKQKKRSDKMQLLHFYNFQAKDSKKDYIVQLRKRFEEDKKHIEEMKKNRKFKPF